MTLENDPVFKYKIKKQQDLFNYIKNRIDKISNYSLLLGAGASVTSGIKTGEDLVNSWRQDIFNQISDGDTDYSTEIARAKIKETYGRDYDETREYSSLFKLKYDLPAQRRNFVEKEIKNTTLSIGYRYLANLVEANYFNTIFTTNFDQLIEQSLLEANLKINAIVCSHDASVSSIPVVSNRPKIIKLHGDFLFDDIKATLSETARLEKNMEDKFEEFIKNFGLIVIGYSGRDDSIMNILEKFVNKEGYLDSGLYWCIRNDDEVLKNDRLRRLLSKDKVFIVRISGFDEFMAELNDSIPTEEGYDKKPYKIKKDKITYSAEINRAKELFPRHTIIQRDCEDLEKSDIFKAIRNLTPLDKKQKEENTYNSIKDPKIREILAEITDCLSVSNENKAIDIISKYEKLTDLWLQEPPLFNQIIRLKIQLLKQQCRYKEIFDALQLISDFNKSISSDEVWPIIQRIETFLKTNQFEQSLQLISTALATYPNSYRLYILSANCKEKLIQDSPTITVESIIDDYKHAILLNPSVKHNSAYLELADFVLSSKSNFNCFGEENFKSILLAPFKQQNIFDVDYVKIFINKILFDIKQNNSSEEQKINTLKEFYKTGITKGGYRYKSALFHNYLKACRKLKDSNNFTECTQTIPDYLKSSAWFIIETAKFVLETEKSLDEAIKILEEGLKINTSNSILELLCEYQLYSGNFQFVEKNLNKFSSEKRFDFETDLLIHTKKFDELYLVSKKKFEESFHSISDYMKYSYHLLICRKYAECLALLEQENSKSDILTINYELARQKSNRALRKEKIELIYKRQNSTLKAAAAMLLNNPEEAKKILKEEIDDDYLTKYVIQNFPIFQDLEL